MRTNRSWTANVAAEAGFHEEGLELLPGEVQRIRDEMGALEWDEEDEA